MSKIINRTGEKHITNEGYEIEIIEYFNRLNCTIQFQDGTTIKNRKYHLIIKGGVKNPHHKSVCNVGYFGVGNYGWIGYPKAYQNWQNMLERCYDEKCQQRQPTYKECTVNERWHNFQVFAKWHEENYKEDYVLDKDILIKGNKIYSPETCCFVPQEINGLFTKSNSTRGDYPIGVYKLGAKFRADLSINNNQLYLGMYTTPKEAFQAYKTAKEMEIKRLADKWKRKIDPQVYDVMYNYQVEITD